MNDKRFIVVSGLPGSGKTTLARRLSEGLGLPLLDKDEILERLFELKGTGDAAWRRALSRESDDLLEHEAKASQGAVLVSFWQVAGMPASSGTPAAWLRELAGLVVHVLCICAPEVAAARFLQRRRHPGHLDHASTHADILASFQAQARLGPLSLRPTISVDTSDEVDIAGLVGEIQAVLTRGPILREAPAVGELRCAVAGELPSIVPAHTRVAPDGGRCHHKPPPVSAARERRARILGAVRASAGTLRRSAATQSRCSALGAQSRVPHRSMWRVVACGTTTRWHGPRLTVKPAPHPHRS